VEKQKNITKPNSIISYFYDPMGNRIGKSFTENNQTPQGGMFRSWMFIVNCNAAWNITEFINYKFIFKGIHACFAGVIQ
jgi:hypothetical protein